MIEARQGLRLRAAWAGILSFVVPGLGQVYARAWRLGFALLIGNELISIVARLIASRLPPTVPGLSAVAVVVFASFVLMVVSSIDAARRVWKTGAGRGALAGARVVSAQPAHNSVANPMAGLTAGLAPDLAPEFDAPIPAGPRPPFGRRLLPKPGFIRPAFARFPARWYRSTWVVASVLLALGFIVDAAIPFRWRTFTVPSNSMVPSLMAGDFVAADARPALRIQRGDVILFTNSVAPPANLGADTPPPLVATFVKRVIGLPGDRVAIRDGRVVLNGQPLPRREDGNILIERYMAFDLKANRWIETLPNGRAYPVATIPDQPDQPAATRVAAKTIAEITLPPGQLYVLGDNRDDSLDSRFSTFGTIPISHVIARARTIYWSADRARLMTPVP